MNTERKLNQAATTRFGSTSTRRDLIAATPLTASAVAACASFRGPLPAVAEVFLPRGKDAAQLAAKVTTSSWPQPKSFVPGMHYCFSRSRLERLLGSYAEIHAARVWAEPSASHMLSVADVISPRPYSWPALGKWLDGEQQRFDPAKFPLVWRQARVIDLERHTDQLARLDAVRQLQIDR